MKFYWILSAKYWNCLLFLWPVPTFNSDWHPFLLYSSCSLLVVFLPPALNPAPICSPHISWGDFSKSHSSKINPLHGRKKPSCLGPYEFSSCPCSTAHLPLAPQSCWAGGSPAGPALVVHALLCSCQLLCLGCSCSFASILIPHGMISSYSSRTKLSLTEDSTMYKSHSIRYYCQTLNIVILNLRTSLRTQF